MVFGILLASETYRNFTKPLDLARSLLSSIQSTSNPQIVANNLITAKTTLPESGNAVWVLPTDDTDFGMMQNNLNNMLSSVNKIQHLSPDDFELKTTMLNVHAEATTIVFSLHDAESYVWITPAFVFSNLLWVSGYICLCDFTLRHKSTK